MKCPNCGADITNNKCEYCGYQIPEDKEGKTINITNNYYAPNEYEHREGMVKQKYRAKYKSNTWLWVLGWIFVFPIPLTILMLRNKELEQKARYIIIAIAWVVYLLFVVIGGSRRNESSNDRSYHSEEPTTLTEVTEAKTTEQQTTEQKTTEVETTEVETTEGETTEELTTEKTDLSNSDVKKFVDEYEAFIDKYVEVVNSYNANPTDTELLSQYTEIMAQYAEFSKAAADMEDSPMTPEEEKYFTDAMFRIDNKLLSALTTP